jgi:hypothetical protein
MNRKLALLPVAFFTACTVVAQVEPKPLTAIDVNEVYIYAGINTTEASYSSLEDFRQLAPGSMILRRDFSDHMASNGLSLYTNSMFAMNIGVRFANKERNDYRKPQLRIGFSYFSQPTLSNNYYRVETKPYDTLSSTQTGQAIYIDSVITSSYSMEYSTRQLRLDASLVFRANPQGRFSLYSGIGFTAGWAIQANTHISHVTGKGVQSSAPGSYSSGNTSQYEFSSENFINQSGFGCSAFIPLGIDLRVGKKREFLKMLHLFYEVRPQIDVTRIPELRTVTNAGLQHGMGLRVTARN